MITEVRAKNCFSFNDEIVFSLKADMRNKKFASNVCTIGNYHVLKTAGIYGSNNSGKTNLLRCVRTMWGVMSNRDFVAVNNYFSNNPIVEIGISFVFEEREFSYDIKKNIFSGEFVYEKFQEIKRDQYGNEKIIVWLVRDSINSYFDSIDEKMKEMIGVVSKNNILIYLVDTNQFKYMSEMKRILTSFALSIDIIDMNNIPWQKTIDMLKNHDQISQKVVSFIKNADLYMDDYYFADDNEVGIKKETIEKMEPQENVLNIPDQIVEQMHLMSVYKGVKVPSVLFDSTGTKKIAALASYIIEALEKGRIVFVDELDSSIHFKLTRAIVSMFNNELNTKAQLIFTIHDVSIMDCKRMFRKEQIWFVHKDNTGVYLYSLADFTAQEGVRDTTDIIDKYKRGVLGALPDPELINVLIEISKGNNENE